jgi:hypothetical protein
MPEDNASVSGNGVTDRDVESLRDIHQSMMEEHISLLRSGGIDNYKEVARKLVSLKFSGEELKTIELSEKKFLFPTSHLIHFDLIDRLTKLYGEEYIVIKKALWYCVLSLPLRTRLADVGDIHTDLRFHVAFPLPSGKGKKNLSLTLSKIAEKFGLNISVPTSLHPEQLIGKVIRERVRTQVTFDKIEGHLADDLVIIDEATELIRSKEPPYRESRKYINVALDPFGSNKISKRMVDTPREEALEYFPPCDFALFFQPFIFGEEVVLIGFLRRFLIIYVPIKMDDLGERYSKRIDSETINDEKIVDPLLKTLGDMKNNFNCIWSCFANQFSFSEASKKRLKELHLELIKQGLNRSKKGRNFIQMVDFSLQDLLVKMSCIQAGSRLRTNVEVEDIEYAYIDLAEFFQCTLNFIDQKIYGNLDYGKGLDEASEEDINCINWLIAQGSTSLGNSTISIRTFIQHITQSCGIALSGANYRYNRMKENGWIDSKQIGQYDSRVWVKNQGIKDNKGNNITLGEFTMREYFSITDKIKKLHYNP